MSTTAQSLQEADQAFQNLYAKMPPDGYSTNPDSTTLAWSTSYMMMGMLAYYDYSQDSSYIDTLVGWIDNMMQTRDSVTGQEDVYRHEVLPAWSTDHYTPGNYCWIVHNGMIGYSILWTCRTILNDATLKAKYGSKASTYIDAMKDMVAAFQPDFRPIAGSNPPQAQYWMVYYGQYTPFNQQNAMGRALILLGQLTGDSSYSDMATQLANFQLSYLTDNNGAYTWDYSPPNGHNPGVIEDISHGAIDVDFAWLCYNNGITFTEDDLNKFIQTLQVCTETSGQLTTGYTTNVDGTGGVGNDSFHMGRWGHLAFLNFDVINNNLITYYNDEINWTGDNIPCMLAAGYMCQVLSS